MSLVLKARSDEAFRRLLARFVDLYATDLCNPHWGEQVRAEPDNHLVVSMMFQSLTKDEARAAWTPLIDFADAHGTDYEGQNSFNVGTVPARYLWNGWFWRILGRSFVNFDGRPAASWTDFWWRVSLYPRAQDKAS